MNRSKRQIQAWTDEALSSLIDMRRRGMKVPQIATILQRPPDSVYAMCKRLIRSQQLTSSKARLWTIEEINILKSGSLIDEQVARLFGRTTGAVSCKRLRLDLPPNKRKRWTADLDSELLAMREGGSSFAEIGSRIQRTESAVSNRISHLIKEGRSMPLTPAERSRRGAQACALRRQDRWSKDEQGNVINLWNAGHSSKSISTIVGRSKSAIDNVLGAFRKTKLLQCLSVTERQRRIQEGRARRFEDKCAAAAALVQALPDTKAAGYIIGVLFGDGFISVAGHRGSVGLKSTNESFCRAFADALQETFKCRIRILSRVEPIKRIGTYVYRDVLYFESFFHSVHTALALRARFGFTDERRWCADPRVFLNIGKAFVDGVLQGFFDSEGSFMRNKSGRYYVSACSVNGRGLKSIAELLRRRGYRARLTVDRRKQWRVAIHRSLDVLRFATKIGSRIDYKARRMQECLRMKQSKLSWNVV